MAKTKTVKIPAGIRTKLMAAVAMLLVSTILMVSSTYAWFTLSTAPEVTGITTSVGANGNLEIALLNGYTYTDLEKIGSGQGTSTAATGNVTESNITWGNLVDLSDAAYGLNLVALNPAALNYGTKIDTSNEEVEDRTKVSTAFLLQTAVYGADGRVADLDANTITGVYNSTNGKWVGKQTIGDTSYPAYGVRAIGVDSNMTVAQIAMIAAKAAVSDGANNAADPVAKAVSANWMTFLTLATSMSDTNPAYSADDVTALKAVAEGVQSSLNTIVKTYSNAALAELASTAGVTDEMLTAMRSQLGDNTSAATLEALMDQADVNGDDYSARLTALKDAQTKVAAVLTACNTYAAGSKATDGTNDATTATAIKDEIVKPLIGTTVKAYDADGAEVEKLSASVATSGDIASVYLSDPNGLVSVVAVDAGTYEMCRVVAGTLEVSVYAGPKEDTPTPGNLAAVANAVAGMSAAAADTNAETTIADFYGYVIDFAFRTNATESNLMLQTIPTNRVYSNAEGSNLATQGAGSTATFMYDKSLNTDQVTALLEAVRLVFMDTEDGTIHANGKLTEININTPASTATANVRLFGTDDEAITAANAAIVGLDQNVAKMVSVLVYLDGKEVDNGDVANAASSGMLNLNLQFSSSANLIPMENTALKNMVVTYTELTDVDYKAGLYTYGNVIYTVDDGYKIYKGSDGMTYYGQVATGTTEPTEYIKLTAINLSDALTPLTVDFAVDEGEDDIIKVGETLDLSVSSTSAANATIKSVIWESADEKVATVTDTATLDSVVVVTGAGAGTTKINAAIELEYAGETSGTTTTKTVYAYYTVSVTVETTTPDGNDTQQGGTTTYNVTLPDAGVTGEATATAGQAYTFTVANGYTLGEVTVGGTPLADGTLVAGENGAYTIPGTSVTGEIVINVTAPATPATYTVTVNGGGEGGTVTGATDSAKEKDQITLTAAAADGYVFGGWTVTEGGVRFTDDTATTVTFTMPASNVTVIATFTATQSGG